MAKIWSWMKTPEEVKDVSGLEAAYSEYKETQEQKLSLQRVAKKDAEELSKLAEKALSSLIMSEKKLK